MRPADSIKRLESWFNKKLTGDQFIEFNRRLKYIPAPALADIVSKYIDDNPPVPSRFPSVSKIQAGWFIWKKDNPQAIKQPPRTECTACCGEGFLWFRESVQELGPDYTCEVVARCGDCRNWIRQVNDFSPIPTKYRDDLESAGIDVFPPRPVKPDNMQRRDVEAVANNITEVI